MLDLDAQIREYLDAVSAPLTVEDILETPIGEGLVRPLTSQPARRPVRPLRPRRPRRQRQWPVTVAVVAATLILVGGVAWLVRFVGDVAPVEQPTTTVPVSSLAWSRVPHDESILGGSGDQIMSSVTAGGPGLVAVGSDGSGGDPDAAVWTSSDGITWSRVLLDEATFGGEGSQAMSSVTVGGPGLVAVGSDQSDPITNDAAVWTSSDGITWSRVPHDEATLGGPLSQEMSSVTAGGPGLVAVGSDWSGGDPDAAVWTSSDGITWSRVPHDEATFGGPYGQEMVSVTAGGPGLVAVGSDHNLEPAGWTGSDAAVWTSSDGITWSRVPHDEATLGGSGMSSVTGGGPGLVAVGWDRVWTSSDGITWSWVLYDEAILGGSAVSSVTVGGPGLVAVGDSGSGWAGWTSWDGITWSRVLHDEATLGGEGSQVMSGVTAGGPGLVAVGWVWSSGGDSDAAVWTTRR